MKSTVELIYYRIIQITTIYKGKDLEEIKAELLQRKDEDGYKVFNDWEYVREIEEAVLNLCKWGILMFNHGYLFHGEYIAPGTDLTEFVPHREELYHRVYRRKMERYERLKPKEEVE